jgi:hypothetical protein
MEARFKKRCPARAGTALLAAILLIAQCVAVAHYHPRQNLSFCSSGAVSLDNGLCSLCLMHQYSPPLAAAPFFPCSPTIIGHIELYAAQSWPLYAFSSYLSGRSPPAQA